MDFFDFVDLDDDSIYSIFKYLDLIELIKYERCSIRIGGICKYYQRRQKGLLVAIKYAKDHKLDSNIDPCGDQEHWPGQQIFLNNVHLMTNVMPKLPNLKALYLIGNLNFCQALGSDFGPKLVKSIPHLSHVHVEVPEKSKITDIVLLALFEFIDHLVTNGNINHLSLILPNGLPNVQMALFSSKLAGILETCPKLKMLSLSQFSPVLLSCLQKIEDVRFNTISCIDMDKLASIWGDNIKKLEIKKYTFVNHSDYSYQDPIPYEESIYMKMNNLQSLKLGYSKDVYSYLNLIADSTCNLANLTELEIEIKATLLEKIISGDHKITKLLLNDVVLKRFNELPFKCANLEYLSLDADPYYLNSLAIEDQIKIFNQLDRLRCLKLTFQDIIYATDFLVQVKSKINTIPRISFEFNIYKNDDFNPLLIALNDLVSSYMDTRFYACFICFNLDFVFDCDFKNLLYIIKYK